MPSLHCIDCQTELPISSRIYNCPKCEGLLDVVYGPSRSDGARLVRLWDERRASTRAVDQSGVWRFRELLPEADESEIVTMIEGNTQVWDAPRSAAYAGMERLVFKHL